MNVVNLREALRGFADTWHPRIVGAVGDVEIKVVKLDGEFVWHHHDETDELFLVVDGVLRMRFRTAGVEDEVTLHPGEFVVVPLGVEHCPVADAPCSVMLIERKDTINTGSAGGDRTVQAVPLTGS